MKKVMIAVVVAVVGIGAVAYVHHFRSSRLTPDRLREIREARLREAQALQEESGSAQEVVPIVDESPVPPKGEDVVRVELTLSNGTVLVDLYPEWAPIGVERMIEMVEGGVLDDCRIFRVVKGFAAQFGIPGDPKVAARWSEAMIKDEPVKASNVRGTLTFAKSSLPNSRTTQLFFNLGDNSRLDADGFSPIGKVVHGMDVIEGLNGKYGDEPTGRQGEIQAMGNAFLDSTFPGLDYVKKAAIVEGPGPAEAKDPHAGHDHAKDPHAGHDHAKDPHAGHDHAKDPHAGHDHAKDPHAGHDH